MPAYPQESVLNRITSLMEEINGSEKRATEMGLTGEGKKDPGGYQGESTHPSARAASNVQKTPVGSRAKENEADVKKEHPGAGVDNTNEKGGDQDSKTIQGGLHVSATGEDPKVEDHYRAGGKDDKRQGDRGGTEGPFNAEDIGEKYSSLHFPEITKLAYAKMNEVIADIGNGLHVKEAYDIVNQYQPVETGTQPNHKQASQQVDPATAAAAGYNLAAGTLNEETLQKQAAVQATIEQTILDAYNNADLVGEYVVKYAAECEHLFKKGNDGAMGGAMEGESPMPPPEAGAAPPPDMGGGPPGGEAPPGGGGGEGGPGEGIEDLINALLEMGMTPEDIMQALQEHEGGAGGGGDPGAGGPPMGPEGGPPPEMGGGPKMGSDRRSQLKADREVLHKLASVAHDRFRKGQFQMKPVQKGTKEATDRQDLQRYIIEVCQAR